ncbi:MAG: hypothetical protein ACQ9MH_06925 [Nitrospinales bacterium]
MKKLVLVALVAIVSVCFTASAFAGSIKPGEKTTCNNAKSITLEATGQSNAGDRSNANAVIWKSSNATTVPISLGSKEDHGLPGGAFGNKADNLSKKGWLTGAINMSEKHSMGRGKVVLMHQPNFSRGDSIGDISGEVRITNTGTTGINVTCG